MLALNIGKLSEVQLTVAAAGQCARFGTVKNIKILPPAAHRNYAIAAVEMSTAIEADRLRVNLGDIKIGQVVIIRLMPEPGMQTEGGDESDDEAAADLRSRDPVDILLVEDDPADVRMTREALKAAGVAHRLHVVADGMEAISFLCKTRQFDDAPRPDDALRDIPVVVFTSSKAHRDVRLSYQADADWFVTKPAGLDAYADAMKRIETLITH